MPASNPHLEAFLQTYLPPLHSSYTNINSIASDFSIPCARAQSPIRPRHSSQLPRFFDMCKKATCGDCGSSFSHPPPKMRPGLTIYLQGNDRGGVAARYGDCEILPGQFLTGKAHFDRVGSGSGGGSVSVWTAGHFRRQDVPQESRQGRLKISSICLWRI